MSYVGLSRLLFAAILGLSCLGVVTPSKADENCEDPYDPQNDAAACEGHESFKPGVFSQNEPKNKATKEELISVLTGSYFRVELARGNIAWGHLKPDGTLEAENDRGTSSWGTWYIDKAGKWCRQFTAHWTGGCDHLYRMQGATNVYQYRTPPNIITFSKTKF